MWKTLKTIQKNLIITLPAAMLLGLILGTILPTEGLKQLITPLTFLMIYPMMITLNIKELLKKGNLKLQGTALLINFIITPFIGFALGKIFFADRPLLAIGILLASLLPTSGMTISWTGFAKGNLTEAIKMTVIGLITGALLMPIYLQILMGTTTQLSLTNTFTQVALIVFLPLILGIMTQLLLKKSVGEENFKNKYKEKFPLISTIGVLAIVFISIALKAKTILAEPQQLIYYLIPLLILYLINFLISTIIAKKFFKPAEGKALVFGTVMRNLTIALGLAVSLFGKEGTDIALIIALAFIIQVQGAAWYVKLTPKIFKDTTEPTINTNNTKQEATK